MSEKDFNSGYSIQKDYPVSNKALGIDEMIPVRRVDGIGTYGTPMIDYEAKISRLQEQLEIAEAENAALKERVEWLEKASAAMVEPRENRVIPNCKAYRTSRGMTCDVCMLAWGNDDRVWPDCNPGEIETQGAQ